MWENIEKGENLQIMQQNLSWGENYYIHVNWARDSTVSLVKFWNFGWSMLFIY